MKNPNLTFKLRKQNQSMSLLLSLVKSFIPAVCSLGISSNLIAQAVWNPTDGTTWSTSPTQGVNWTNGANIATGGLALQFGTGSGLSVNNFAPGYSVGSITFNNTAGAYTLQGNRVTMASGGIIANGSTADGAPGASFDQLIEFDFDLNSTGTRSVSSTSSKTITFTGNVTGTGTFYITSGNVTFLGELSNTGGAYRTNDTLLKLLNANNSFTDNARAAAGILSTNNIANSGVNSSLGRGSTISLGQNYARGASIGTLQLTNESNSKTGFAGNAASGTTNRTINISNGLSAPNAGTVSTIGNWGGATIENTVAGQTATFNGNVTASNRYVQSSLWLMGAGNGNLNGNIANGTVTAGAPTTTNAVKTDVVKAGTGTWELNASNAYAGTTTIYDGVVKIGHSKALGSGGFTTQGTKGATIITSGQTRNVTSNGGAALVTNAAAAGTLDLNGQTNVNEVISIKGNGFGGMGALVNNSSSAASIGNGIASITFTSSGGNSVLPTFTITGGGGSGATAIGTLGVTAQSFTILPGNEGSGYVDATNRYASLSIGGGDSGSATAKIIMSGGKVTGIEILSMGSGFSSSTPTTITVNDASAFVGTKAIFTPNNSNFAVELAVTNAGTGYTSAPTITFSSGNNTAVANLSSVNLDGEASVGGSGDLIVNAVVSSTNETAHMTKVGAGTLTLNAVNTYTSGTNVDQGTLQVGTGGNAARMGSALGDVVVNVNGSLAGTGFVDSYTRVYGLVKPGDSSGANTGKLTFTNNLRFEAPAVGNSAVRAIITLNGATLNEVNPEDGIQSIVTGSGNHDQIIVNGNLNLRSGTKIQVELATGYNAAYGDVFNIFDWTSVTSIGSTNAADFLILPTLTAGRWATDQFFSDGIIYVVVPEPGRALLLCAGLSVFLFRRQRSKTSIAAL